MLSQLVAAAAPNLFSADASGSGVAAATAVRTLDQLQTPLPVFSCSSAGCASVPLVLGIDTPIFVSFYGTGIRGASPADVIVSIGGIQTPVQYAGPQSQFAGLDQINVPLPLSLRNAGEVNVTVTIAGRASNTVRIAVQ